MEHRFALKQVGGMIRHTVKDYYMVQICFSLGFLNNSEVLELLKVETFNSLKVLF